MDNLHLELLIIDGKKKKNCSRLLLFFHLLFVMLISAICTYYFHFTKYNGDNKYKKILANKSLLDNDLEKMENDILAYNEKIGYYLNYVNQFVENGYEVFTAKIYLENWTETQNYKKTFKISFKKDYSSKPYIFYTMNKLQKLAIRKTDTESELKNSIYITLSLKKLMTSYFIVELEINMTVKINEDEVVENLKPYVELQYLILNNPK